VHPVPHDPLLRAFTAGMADNRLYLLDTQQGDATPVLEFDAFASSDGRVVHAEGDHKIHVLNVHSRGMEVDPMFDLDLNRDIPTGPARPHGMAIVDSRLR
jgi:hypothetical protein